MLSLIEMQLGKSSAEDADHGWPSRNSVVLHVVFNKESSNFVTGVKVIERCQTSKGYKNMNSNRKQTQTAMQT